MKTIEEAKLQLTAALPLFRTAANKAKANGTAMLGILSVNPDGSGNVMARFECEEFFEDLALILGVGEITEEQKGEVEAFEFLSKNDIKVE